MSVRRRKRGLRDETGAALAEYGLLLAGVALVSMLAVSVLGHKVGGLVGSVATMIPGSTQDLDAPVLVGKMLETETKDVNGDGVNEITFPLARVTHQNAGEERGDLVLNSSRLGQAMGMDTHDALHLYQQSTARDPFAD